jgi:DnaJ-class molecular chaperone
MKDQGKSLTDKSNFTKLRLLFLFPADLVFIVKELPHATYKREGNDLHHTATLPLVKALTGTSLNLTTLDNRVLNVSINEVIK